MGEHPIAMFRREGLDPGHWVMVVGTVRQGGSDITLKKIKTFSEAERSFVHVLTWLNNQTWKMTVAITVYITIIITHLMLTELASIWFLVTVHQVCSIIYALDFFLAIIHRTKYLPAKIPKYKRQIKWLVIDAISLLPLTPIYIAIHPDFENETVFWFSFITFLRVYRIQQFFTETSTAAGIPHLRLTLLQYTLYFLQSVFSFAVWWMKRGTPDMELNVKDWNKAEANIFFVSLYFSFMTFTNTGFGDIAAKTPSQRIICSIAMLIGFSLTSGILVGSLTSQFLQAEKPREKYRREYDTTVKRLKRVKMDKLNQGRILYDLSTIWKYKGGVTDSETFDLFPISLKKEICFDIAFGLLNRSPIFSGQDRSFLRSVSLAMKNKTYMPGDEISHPIGVSHGMLCVASGVVEILSKENEDTPIISFSSGTLLCEISLFMPMPIQNILRAATVVELQTLDTTDFYHLVRKYPENYSSMRQEILQRYSESLKISLDTEITTLDPEENINYRHKKLKKFIEDLRKDDLETEGNMIVRPDSSSAVFKSDMLHLYVLTENIPRVKTVPITLVRNKPWILRPDTPLLHLWRLFIFVVVTIVIFAYPYLAAFVRKIDNKTFTLLIFVQVVYTVDLVIQCITAIPRNDLISYKTSVKEIVASKLKSYGFYLDVLASYYLEVFAPLFSFGSPDYTSLLLSQNKLLKIWVVPAYFKRIEDELSTNLILIRMLKYIYIVTWLIHFCSTVLYLEACPLAECHPDRWFSNLQEKEAENRVGKPYTEHPYVASLYLAMMITSTTGFGNVPPSSMEDIYTIIFMIILGLIAFNYCVAEISVTFKHRLRKRTEFQEMIFATDRFLVEHNLPHGLRRRMSNFFKIQWAYDQGVVLKRDIPIEQLPKKHKKHMLLTRLRILQAVPIFKGANPGFMKVLAKGSKVRMVPENEMVVYAGGFDKEMYILQNGYCKVTEKGRPLKSWIIGPLSAFGDLEMIQGIPVTMNVKTLTDTRIICIEYSTYLRAVTKFPNVRRDIEFLMETKAPKFKMSAYEMSYEEEKVDTKKRKKLTISNAIREFLSNSIINVYKYDKSTGQNYWTPFLAWRKLHFLKYTFLPYVIKPDSIFLYIWMAIRISSSVMMGFLTPVYFSIPAFLPFLRPILLFLQVISWIDLYLTFHVAYYDNKGILTFHPAKTVVRYVKSNFALDFFLVFPYFWIPEALGKDSGPPSLLYNGASLIKVFQFYKFLQASNYYESDILRRADTLKLLKYVPTILIITNVAAAILILIDCEIFDPNEALPQGDSTIDIYRRSIKKHCSGISNVKNATEDLLMYSIAYYWITATMTSAGLGDVVAQNVYTLSICIFYVILGVFLYGCMFASIASSKIRIHYNVVKYRARMKEMMKFLEKENINKEMQNRFFKHYLYVWNRTLGHTPQHTLSQIHTALKQDIFDFMYEKTLRKVSVFTFTEKPFTRSIGKYIDEVYFLKGETIVKHNHITTDLYIIYKGEVYVSGPDNKLITRMGAGGLFGNISEKSHKLSSITAITASKVELIRLRNEDFQRTLMNYPGVKNRITAVTGKNQDYILPYMETDSNLDNIDIEIPDEWLTINNANLGRDLSRVSVLTDPTTGKTLTGRFYLGRSVYRPPTKTANDFVILSESWLHNTIRIITIYLAYVSSILTSYVFAFQDFRYRILVPYFLLDIFFYLKIFLELHYTYFDSRGDHIHILAAIKKKYLSSRRFYIDLFANLPLDIFVIAAPTKMTFTVVSFLRLNRLLRFYYIIEYYNSQMNSLMVKIILLEFGTLGAWITLMIHLSACLWYMAACPIFYCENKSWLKDQSLENAEKYDQYVASLYYMVTLMTTTGYGDIVSQNQLEIFLSTFVLISSHFAMLLCSAGFLAMIGINSMNFVKYDESILQLRKDLSRQKVNKYQLTKMWQYLQLLWQRENGRQIPQFIDSAPYMMKCDVYSAMYGEHLSRSFIFIGLDENFSRQLTVYMVRYVFFPGNYIVQQGDNDGTMYFIHKGEISVMTIHKDLMETIHYNVKDNDQFGISQGLIFGQPHQFSYRAETEVEVLSLTLGHWQHLFKFFPQVKPIIYDRLKKIS